MEENGHRENITIQQPSKVGGILTLAAVGAGVVGAIVITKKIKDAQDLKKVRFDAKNIPQYSRAQLIEFRDVCCNGEKPKPGRKAECNIYDPKMVACAWVPKVLAHMDAKKLDVIYMWRPGLIAQRLYEEMKGVAFSEAVWDVTKMAILGPLGLFLDSKPNSDYSTRQGLFLSISKLNVDQLRWLHNWWVIHHADGDNLYQWIGGEVGVSQDIRNAARSAMDRAGVGSKIVTDRSKIA